MPDSPAHGQALWRLSASRENTGNDADSSKLQSQPPRLASRSGFVMSLPFIGWKAPDGKLRTDTGII